MMTPRPDARTISVHDTKACQTFPYSAWLAWFSLAQAEITSMRTGGDCDYNSMILVQKLDMLVSRWTRSLCRACDTATFSYTCGVYVTRKSASCEISTN